MNFNFARPLGERSIKRVQPDSKFSYRIRLVPLALAVVLIFFLPTCDDDAGDSQSDATSSGKDQFESETNLSSRWCMEAQIQLARLERSEFEEDDINAVVKSTFTDFSSTKSNIVPGADKPIEIVSFYPTMSNASNPDLPADIAKEALCKFRSQEGIEAALGVQIEGDEGTCMDMNQRALDWALQQLSQEELDRYENEGKKLKFEADQVTETGSGWFGVETIYTLKDDTYEVSSSALLISYADNPDQEVFYRGVHYCKLMPPSQVLFWLLERAFWDDPLGDGPLDSGYENARLVAEETDDCRLKDRVSPGSCYFYFPVAADSYCEEYPGPFFDATEAKAKCDSRQDGVFSEKLCIERGDETDGKTLGECVIGCGTDEERIWNVYRDEPGGMTLEEGCTAAWFPATD
jgi:hypothetical protein